jgi:hypothetical protein
VSPVRRTLGTMGGRKCETGITARSVDGWSPYRCCSCFLCGRKKTANRQSNTPPPPAPRHFLCGLMTWQDPHIRNTQKVFCSHRYIIALLDRPASASRRLPPTSPCPGRPLAVLRHPLDAITETHQHLRLPLHTPMHAHEHVKAGSRQQGWHMRLCPGCRCNDCPAARTPARARCRFAYAALSSLRHGDLA